VSAAIKVLCFAISITQATKNDVARKTEKNRSRTKPQPISQPATNVKVNTLNWFAMKNASISPIAFIDALKNKNQNEKSGQKAKPKTVENRTSQHTTCNITGLKPMLFS
jgi:hypothetical protein